MNDIWDSIELVIATYRDHVNKEVLQRFKEEYYLTLSAEAEARRSKTSTLIKSIAKLRIELQKFEYTYSLLKNKIGDLAAVETMICELNHQIDSMICQKNRR